MQFDAEWIAFSNGANPEDHSEASGF